MIFRGKDDEHVYDKSVIQMAEQEVFLQNDPIQVVDACLLILVSMSYIIPTRQDLLGIFEETIEINIQKFIQKPASSDVDNDVLVAAKSVLLPTHFSLVIGYYGDLLFKKNANASKITIQFLFDSVADNAGKFEVISLGCADTLTIIVTDTETLPHMVNEIDMVVEKLIILIQKVEYL